MLGREYHNELLNFFCKNDAIKRKEYWEDRYFERLSKSYQERFKSAKSMLVQS
jgi:hypothetical protein